MTIKRTSQEIASDWVGIIPLPNLSVIGASVPPQFQESMIVSLGEDGINKLISFVSYFIYITLLTGISPLCYWATQNLDVTDTNEEDLWRASFLLWPIFLRELYSIMDPFRGVPQHPNEIHLSIMHLWLLHECAARLDDPLLEMVGSTGGSLILSQEKTKELIIWIEALTNEAATKVEGEFSSIGADPCFSIQELNNGSSYR